MGTRNNGGPSKWETQQVCSEFVFALPPFVNPHWLTYASHDAYRPSTSSRFEDTYRSSCPFNKLQHSAWRRRNRGPTPAHWSPQQQLWWNDTTTAMRPRRHDHETMMMEMWGTYRQRVEKHGGAGRLSPTRRKTWRCGAPTLPLNRLWILEPGNPSHAQDGGC